MEEEIKRKDLEVLWTVEQVATYFSIRKSTVYQWIASGNMIDQNKLVYVGKLVRIPRSEVERIANQKRARIVKEPMPILKPEPEPEPEPEQVSTPTPARPATPLE